MNEFIKNNNIRKIRKYAHRATLANLKYAWKKGNEEAVFLILQNPTIKRQLFERCTGLSDVERSFLLNETDPRDVADLIRRLTEN